MIARHCRRAFLSSFTDGKFTDWTNAKQNLVVDEENILLALENVFSRALPAKIFPAKRT
jgi:16S rRNA G1207 methylase RsmC